MQDPTSFQPQRRVEPTSTPGYGPASDSGSSMRSNVRLIKRVDVGSAFKIGALVLALMFAILGAVFILLPSMLGASFFAMLPGANRGGAGLGMLGAGFFYLLMIAVYAIIGGLSSALYAWAYNLIAGWVGGLEIEVG